MIPKNSTPIKNEILINVFAQGKLSYLEGRIAFYIIRWSWGFNGIKRRQDWTKKLTKKQIAEDIKMSESHLNEILNKMVKENKIILKDNCYQFNEHYENWKNFPKKEVICMKKLPEKGSQLPEKGSQLPEKGSQLPEKGSLGMPNNSGDSIKNKDLKGDEHLFKETLKETNKETLKEKGIIFKKTLNEFKKMRNKNKKKMTDYAVKLLINKLEKLSDNEDTQIAILNQSIINSWQGVFPLKDKPKMTQEEALKRMEMNENK